MGEPALALVGPEAVQRGREHHTAEIEDHRAIRHGAARYRLGRAHHLMATEAGVQGSMRTPGLRMPAGSRVALAARSASANRSGRWRSYHRRWSRPTEWWWVIVPPWAMSASAAAVLTVAHCSRRTPGSAAPGAMTVKYGAGPSGYTCVNRHVTTAGSAPIERSAPRVAAIPPSYKAGNCSHVHAVSKVSFTRPSPTSASRVYGARMNALRHVPAAPSRPGSRADDRASSTSPSWSRAHSTARSSHASRGWSADSNARRSRCALPSPAPVSPASVASIRRQFAGCRPDWETARAASTPASNVEKRAVADERNVGRSWRRIHASVITPRMPSEPQNMRSGDGPAPEPGRRRLSSTPWGVTTRSPSTKSSMWVYSVA